MRSVKWHLFQDLVHGMRQRTLAFAPGRPTQIILQMSASLSDNYTQCHRKGLNATKWNADDTQLLHHIRTSAADLIFRSFEIVGR